MTPTVCLLAASFADPIATLASHALQAPAHLVALQDHRDVVGWMRRPDVFALVVTARTMPDAYRSAQTVRLARAMASETPIIAVLDAPTPDTALTLMMARAGADHFVFAPAQELAPILRDAARGATPMHAATELPNIFRQRFPLATAEHTAQAATILQAAWRAPAHTTVADLAREVAQSPTQLRRTCARLTLPNPSRILEWARLVHGAQAASGAIASGTFATAALVARAAGYERTRQADHAYRTAAGVTLVAVQRGGEAALLRNGAEIARALPHTAVA